MFIGTICYDDCCHLKRYACNPCRSSLTTTARRISAMNFAIDRMHFKGHIDPWCRETCDPNKFKELDKVSLVSTSAQLSLSCMHTLCITILYIYHHFSNNHVYILLCAQVNTEVCEQTFSWLSQYAKITRHMNREHFLFYILYC